MVLKKKAKKKREKPFTGDKTALVRRDRHVVQQLHRSLPGAAVSRGGYGCLRAKGEAGR